MGNKPYSDSRWWDNPQPKDIQCDSCVHHRGGIQCDAFPDGIPRELLTVSITHNKPYKGDNGIRYEKNPSYTPPPDFLKKAKI